MFATVRRYEGVPDSAEAGRRVQDGFIPILTFADAGDGVMVSTSVFIDKAGAVMSNERAAGWVKENLAALVPNPPQITDGEIVAHG